MSRYFVALSFSLVVYSMLIASMIYVIADDNNDVTTPVMTKTVSVALIQQQCQHKKKAPQRVIEKKEVPKKEVVKKPKVVKKEPPKVLKKEVLKPEIVEKVIEEPIPEIMEKVVEVEEVTEPIEEIAYEESVEEESAEDVIDQQQIQAMFTARQNELDVLTRTLIEKINANKRYPRSARRRGIEGDVNVKFTVLGNGNVSDIKVLEGKSIFERSTIVAIKDSFPIELGKTLLEFPREFTITLMYVLK